MPPRTPTAVGARTLPAHLPPCLPASQRLPPTFSTLHALPGQASPGQRAAPPCRRPHLQQRMMQLFEEGVILQVGLACRGWQVVHAWCEGQRGGGAGRLRLASVQARPAGPAACVVALVGRRACCDRRACCSKRAEAAPCARVPGAWGSCGSPCSSGYEYASSASRGGSGGRLCCRAARRHARRCTPSGCVAQVVCHGSQACLLAPSTDRCAPWRGGQQLRRHATPPRFPAAARSPPAAAPPSATAPPAPAAPTHPWRPPPRAARPTGCAGRCGAESLARSRPPAPAAGPPGGGVKKCERCEV